MVKKCLWRHCFCRMLSNGIWVCCICGEWEIKEEKELNKKENKYAKYLVSK